MKLCDIFEHISDDEINDLYITYMEDMFMEPNEVIITPKEDLNAIYVILEG